MQITETTPKYLNRYLYSDVIPYEVVRVISHKTVEIREMNATRDPSWIPDYVPGGFAGHVRNNDSQRWMITPNPGNPVIRARRTKNGRWSVRGCDRYIGDDLPVRRYDHNF